MRAEQCALRLAIGMVVVKVQPGFADRNDLLAFGRGEQGALAHVRVRVGFMRVEADAGPDIRLALGGGDHLFPFALAGRDVEKSADARLAGAGEHALLVFDQAFVLEVTMGIDQHHTASVAGISSRGNTGVGWSTWIGPSAGSSPSATRSRSLAGMHSASSILVAAIGITGETATARSRMQPQSVARTRSMRAGSVFRSA